MDKKRMELIIDLIAQMVIEEFDKIKFIGLMSGQVGLILFLFYYAKFKNSEEFYEKATSKLEFFFSELGKKKNISSSYSEGITGVIWLINHLYINDFIDVDINSIFEEFDKYLENDLIINLENKKYDFLYEGVGGIMAFINRSENRYDIYEKVLRSLDKTKDINRDGSYSWQVDTKDKSGNFKGINLGISHGISSVLCILSKLADLGILPELSRDLLYGGIKYVLNQQIDYELYGSSFANYSIENRNSSKMSRLAWCYGDLGIGITLFQSAKSLRSEDIEKDALKILINTTYRKNIRNTMIMDPFLCHGTSGAANIYHRMFVLTSHLEFRDAANYWYNRTLDLLEINMANLNVKVLTEEGKETYFNSPAFLEGISGIGLAFISYLNNSLHRWGDSLLLP